MRNRTVNFDLDDLRAAGWNDTDLSRLRACGTATGKLVAVDISGRAFLLLLSSVTSRNKDMAKAISSQLPKLPTPAAAVHGAIEVAKTVVGKDVAEPPIKQKRLEICGKCPMLSNGQCTLCNCIVALKTSRKYEVCPLNKW